MADSHICPHLERCPVAEYLNRPSERIYLQIFCEGVYHQCKRYGLRQAGAPVPENLLPYGGYKPEMNPVLQETIG